MSRLAFCKIFVLLFSGVFLLSTSLQAHWIQSHEKMTEISIEVLGSKGENQKKISDKLKENIPIYNKSGIEYLFMGVVDADMRVNGIYKIDKHCKNYEKEVCPIDKEDRSNCCNDNDIVENDMSDWVVGDHKYFYETKLGGYYHQLEDVEKRVRQNINDPYTVELLAALNGNTLDEKIENLINICKISNSSKMAEHFYKKAQYEWKVEHYKDAFYNLGIAVHLVQDATVPHHSRHILEGDGNGEVDYEKNISDFIKISDKSLFVENFNFTLSDASELVVSNASKSSKFESNYNDFEGTNGIRLAVISVSDLINSFFYSVGYVKSSLDVAMVIDSSGSMTSSDRMNLRKAAAKIFVHNASDEDKIAIIDFDSSARVWWPIQKITENREGILSAIDKIDSSGGTNLGAGLLAGYNELKKSTEPNKKAAIFMTDGQGSYSNQAQLYLNDLDTPDDDWPVYTIGLGSGVNRTILQNIADSTGGIYFALSDPNQLQNVYFEIANLIREDSQPLLNEIRVMFVGETYCTMAEVPTHQESITFLVTWPGSDVSTSLTSPSGRVITSDTQDADVYHAKGLTYELFRIANPETGNWAINVHGVDLDPAGEEVRVNVSSVGPTQPADTTPPVISISNPLNGKTYFDQLPVDFSFMVADPESAITSQSALLNGKPINSKESHILNQLGKNTLTVTATNEANLTSEETVAFYVNHFSWIAPIRYTEGSSIETATYLAKANSTLPIKFAIFDEYNDFVDNSTAKVLVDGTTAEFVYGNTDTDIRIDQVEGEEPKYIVNLHTNFNKWDYQMEVDGEYWIKIYFNDILAAKTKIKLR